ncbi:Hypothetical predicted protein [Olea europaea subsp. europaea]|uniref:Uncharacterized protein n=1 Tax=Olea europaea subsp. europaea TaxID=158383 RepID=A0A8S0TFK0_OLEEU|nr:Hypothetical predicted protein [Olea europaea subsp. europaea]
MRPRRLRSLHRDLCVYFVPLNIHWSPIATSTPGTYRRKLGSSTTTRSKSPPMDNFGQHWNGFPDDLLGTGGSAPSMRCAASNHQESQPTVRRSAKWNSLKRKVFISTGETVTAEGHRRGKCFSTKGWQPAVSARIEYRSDIGLIVAPEHGGMPKSSEIYDTYGKLFGDTGDSTKYALSPTKLSQRGFNLSTDSDREDANDMLPINAEDTDSSGSSNLNRGNSSMNISGRRSGLASIARSHRNGGMSIAKCVDELLSSGYVKKGDVLHLFALWFFRNKDNRNSYCVAKTPFLRFKFVEYCFEQDNMSRERKT